MAEVGEDHSVQTVPHPGIPWTVPIPDLPFHGEIPPSLPSSSELGKTSFPGQGSTSLFSLRGTT